MSPLAGTRMGAVDLARLLEAPHDPTPEQVAIIEAPLEPLLVIAGAGSGKTETMAARVVWLVANGHVRPEEVLGLTFTRKAAAEFADRVGARLRALRRRAVGADIVAQDRPRITTYNAYAAALVSDHGLRLGADPDARLLTEAGRWQVGAHVVETWLGDLTTDVAPSTLTRAVLELAGALAEHLVEPEEAAHRMRALAGDLLDREPVPTGARRNEPRQRTRETVAALSARAEIMALVRAFRQAKVDQGAVDFADQVAVACRIAQMVPEVVSAERARYRVVLLDEYQDTSVAQVHLLAALFGDGHSVTAVGDPHQAIYGWRGASAGAIERFGDVFPVVGPDGTRARCRSLTLATSWRNDRAVLAVANRTAGPLRTHAPRSLVDTGDDPRGSAPSARSAHVHLPVLEARPGAGEGAVVGFYAETSEEEATRVAAFVAAEWARPGPDGTRPTCAVLCRSRAQMPLLAQALRESGLPVEVVGLGGLLGTPEVRDLHSALLVAHDPARADVAMRLLTKIRLGIADLDVLNEYARGLADASRTGRVPRWSAEGRRTAPAEAASIVEAIDRPPPAEWTSPRGRSISATGLARVTALGDALRAIRALGHLSLPELVGTAERLLGLDIEVLARPGADARHARRHLDAFAEAAAAFASGSREVGLGAFLAWLDAAEDYERGLDTVEVEPDPAAVQVMTVHAAKGLEWDVVAVPGLMDGAFPAYDGKPDPHAVPRASGWLTSLATLPYPLRGDSADLPAPDLETPVDHAELAAELENFRRRCGAHAVAEERRLAYVAFTRARRVLVLSGAWWKESAMTARPPSRFLGELERAGLLAPEPDTAWDRPAAAENPGGHVRRSSVWPRPVEPGRRDQVRRAVEAVRGAQADLAAGVSPLRSHHPWWADATLLLEEDVERSRPRADVALPAHLSASAVVHLATDPDRFALDRRRPVPREPTLRARRGTRFHAWLEQHFGAAALLDLDEFPGADEVDAPPDTEFVALQEAFLASPWAARRPIAVEADLETPVAGTMVRCRVDAVFATEHGVEVVDWKTGAPVRDGQQVRARQMQLALYRLAWSRLHGVPLERVGARFVHVAHGVEIPAEPMTEEQILAVVTGLVRVVDDPRPGSPG